MRERMSIDPRQSTLFDFLETDDKLAVAAEVVARY